jgi:hypothetical protein
MVLDLKVVDLGHHFLHALQPRIAELEELVAIQTDKMVVLPIAVSLLVL